MSIKHLTDPEAGDKLFDLTVADVTADSINGAVPNYDIVLSGAAGVTGPSTNVVINRFLFEGTDALGTPDSVISYQSVSGAGTKSMAIKSADLGTTYFSSASLVNPDSFITLTPGTALPTSQAYLKVVINNDNNGIIEIGGVNLKF